MSEGFVACSEDNLLHLIQQPRVGIIPATKLNCSSSLTLQFRATDAPGTMWDLALRACDLGFGTLDSGFRIFGFESLGFGNLGFGEYQVSNHKSQTPTTKNKNKTTVLHMAKKE